MVRISAVIRAYNEGDHLGRLLTGLEQQTVSVDEVVLIDSGSTDDTRAIARAHGATVVEIAPDEFTFGRSLNFGCDAAKNELLMILSAHVYPVYDTFVQHMTAPFQDARTAIAYGRQVGDRRTKYSEARIMRRWFPEVSIKNQAHPFSNNANAVVRKEVWQRLGYDESLTGLEDLDLAKRALEQGMRIDYVAEAPVVHVHEESWSTTRNRYRREAIAYKSIMQEEQFSVPEAVVLTAASVASDYWHAWRDGKLGGNVLEIPKFRTAQFVGATQGFRTDAGMSQDLRRRFYYPDMTRSTPPVEPGRLIEYD